jgi:uncharacterized protein YndB with AHSA1/START domain
MTVTANNLTHIFIQLNRVFPAPRERVFRAWTEPELLKQWWAPKGATTPVVEIDLQVGGRYRFGLQFPEEEILYISGVYRQVDPPEKLVFTWQWEQPDMDFGESQVTVEFHERGQNTEVFLRHESFPNETVRDRHQAGWGEFLDRFGALSAALTFGNG